MATTSATAWDRLAELRATAEEARARVADLEDEQRSAQRRVARAQGPLLDYYERVTALEAEPDPGLERRLTDELREAQASVAIRPVTVQGRVSHIEHFDVRVEGRLAGARRAYDEATSAVDAFIAEHRVALVSERLGEAQRAAVRLVDAAAALGAAWQGWHRAAGEFYAIGAGEDVPPDPLAEARGLNGVLARVSQLAERDPEALIPAPRWASAATEAPEP